MTYDDAAKRLAIKTIGTVESRLDYGAINYNDPITVGIAQWYGVRAAAILCRMRDENPSSWVGVENGINNALAIVPANAPEWNDVRLTQQQGESLRPVLANNKAIQDDQCIQDMEVYKNVAVNNGMDADSNTNSMIFFFTMYHQGPVYAFQVLNAVGAGATLEQFRDGALANPVLGQYANRYNEAYEIIKAGDISGTDPGNPSNPEPEAPELALKYIEVVGDQLLLRLEKEDLLCYPNGSGRWLPSRDLTPVTPDPSDPPVTDPGSPTGSWTHPLPGATLTSGYGPRGLDGFHAGLDLSTTTAAIGGAVLAPFDMEVTQAWEAGTGGLPDAGTFVKGITRSGEPYTFSFFHGVPGSLNVRQGQMISAGHKLFMEGQSGNVTGTHVHIEAWPGHIRGGFRHDSPWYYGDGTPIDALPIFKANGVNI